MEQFMKINTAVNGFVWGPVMLVLLVGTGVYLSIAVGFIQFTKIGYWWKNTIGKIFKKGEAGDGEITPRRPVSHGPCLHRRHGQHRGRHGRDHLRRPRRRVLDVGVGAFRHGDQVL